MSDQFISFKDLEYLPPASECGTKGTEKFPCVKCGGSGVYRGVRIHQDATKCFACNGRGYFTTSPAQRAKAKQKRQEKKAQQAADNLQAFTEKHADLAQYLAEVASWNSFAANLLEGVSKYGSLTEGQERAAYRMFAKHVDRQEAKAQALENAPVIDLAKIHSLFATAKDNGLSRPKLRVDGLSIYPAPLTGKNAGFLYVKDSGTYAGKIGPDGKFYKSREAAAEIEETLAAVAADPKGALTSHGLKTGQCSCCGRTLTNKASIEMGIGPICAANYGLG